MEIELANAVAAVREELLDAARRGTGQERHLDGLIASSR